MDTVPMEEHRRRIVGQQVADLTWIWEDWYNITHDGTDFIAAPKGGGTPVRARAYSVFRDAVRDDFTARTRRAG